MEVKMVLGKCVRFQREGIFEEKTKAEAQASSFAFLVEEKDENGDVISSETTYEFETLWFKVAKGRKMLLELNGRAVFLESGDFVRVDIKNGAGLGVSLIRSGIPEGHLERQLEIDFKTIKKIQVA